MEGHRIKVATPDGEQVVRAPYSNGDFAVHESIVDEGPNDSMWTVTHMPTGYALTIYCESGDAARELTDWVVQLCKEHGVDTSTDDTNQLKNAIHESGIATDIGVRLASLHREYLMARANRADL